MDSFFKYFHQNRPRIPPDPKEWPKEWTQIETKTYPRFKSLQLPAPRGKLIAVTETFVNRRSTRQFTTQQIQTTDLADLLCFSVGQQGDTTQRRSHPSGGGRYPFEVYIAYRNFHRSEANSAPKISDGIYHYNFSKHALEVIIEDSTVPGWDAKFSSSFADEFVHGAPGIILLTFLPQRSSIKYGNLAYKLGLLEAGHIGQNIYLISEVLGLGCCALGVCNEEKIAELLDFDLNREIPIYAFAIGYPTHADNDTKKVEKSNTMG